MGVAVIGKFSYIIVQKTGPLHQLASIAGGDRVSRKPKKPKKLDGESKKIAERLRRAIKRRRWKIEEFKELMRDLRKEKDIAGSRQQINNYLMGQETPKLRWLQEAAKLLHVRPEWLILGKGEPTEEEERIAISKQELPSIEEIGALPRERREDLNKFRQRFEETIFPEYFELTATIQLEFDNVFARYVKYVSPGLDVAGRLEAAQWLSAFLVNPFNPKTGPEVFGSIDVQSPEYTDFAWSMLHTLALAMRIIQAKRDTNVILE